MTDTTTTQGTPPGTPSTASRRALFSGVGAVGAAALLAACGDGSSPSSAATISTTTSAPAASTSTSSAASTGSTSTVLAKVSDIPVGGGVIFADQGVVVTQPASGVFKGFSSICTHQQCPLSSVSNGTINCNCHGSAFSITDGSVQNPPATVALEAKSVAKVGDSIELKA